MSKHTPEPWFRDETSIGSSASDQLNSGYFTAECLGPDAAANALRIVACVNACQGLSTDELEQHGLVSAVGYELIELTKQRDELLTALEEIASCATPYGNRAHSMEKIARAATAKAKGGAS